jgi:multiple sugar transport system permease protein
MARIRAGTRPRAGITFCLPAMVMVGLLLMLPICQAVYYSLTDWDGMTATWRGLATYQNALTDPTVWRVLANNAALLAVVPVAMLLPLGVAVLLHERVWGWRFFRAALFLPTTVSWVVIGMVAARFYAQKGLLNQFLGALGLGFLRTDVLAHERSALIALAATFAWSMIGTNTIIYLTGMSTLDPTLQEAARVDGAGGLRVLWHITLPQLKRFVQFSFVMTVLTAFTALFSLIFVMTGGGPGYGTTTLEYYVYQQAFSQGAFGSGALFGVLLFVIVSIVSVLQVKLLRTEKT